MSVSESNGNIRIRTTPLGSDKYVKINIKQNFDFLEILSLRIGQEQLYRKYCSDYGVIAGRVICNKGVGVPNAKISVFIPISDLDLEDSEIRKIYPYGKIDDQGYDGLKYNLLTQTPLVDDICHTPVGSFPQKRRILDCDPWCEIYGKYYKYSTSTNASGDYMIFGVPTGTQIVHMDVDLSDIGYLSQKPYDMISQGSSVEQFESYNKFASAPNLAQLPQIKTQNKTINVLPLWGNLDECQLGINRVDFDLNYDIQTTAFFVGSIFGDSEKNSINKNCRPRKKLGYMNQLITGPGTIEMIRKTPFGGLEVFEINGNQNIDDDGTWILQLPMNLNHKVTDEFGELIDSGNPEIGIATRASYRFRIGMSDYLKGFARTRSRAKFLVPNYGDYTFDGSIPNTTPSGKPNFANLEWNGIYTVKQFISRYANLNSRECKDIRFVGIKDVYESGSNNPFPYNRFDRNTNPLYIFLCFLIIYVLFPLIFAINAIVSIINAIVDFVNDLGAGLNYAKCSGPECNGTTYAPGCFFPDPNQGPVNAVGLDEYADCFQSKLAEAFNIYSFYFTNDWINGTLYAFLFKYKYKKNNKSKFCNADKDNGFQQYIKDQVCQGNPNPDCVPVIGATQKGVIVEYDYELYYAAQIENTFLFATDIYNLGSSKVCDYFGKPKIITEIPPTTFNFLEDTELGSNEDERAVEDLLLKINCTGVYQNPTQCVNMSRVCELDVNPEFGDAEPIDYTSLEIEAMEVRADLECLNSNQCNLDPLNNNDGAFGQDWKIYRGTPVFNEGNRNLLQGSNKITNSFFFYFGLLAGKTAIDKLTSKYFAPCERKEPCPIVINANIVNNKCTGGNNGSITAIPENGTPPYKYSWFRGQYGPDMTPICVNFTFEPSPISLPTPNPGLVCSDTITNLYSDFYTVVVKDNVGQICKKTFKVDDPVPFQILYNYSPYVCPNTNNGFIEILPVGGTPPYTISWSSGTDITSGGLYTANTDSFFVYNLHQTSICNHNEVAAGGPNTTSTQFYVAHISDSSGQYGCLNFSALTFDITQSCGITLTATSTEEKCSGTTKASITLGVNGGVPPYTFIIEGPSASNYYWSGTSFDSTFTKIGMPGGPPCNGYVYTATCIDFCGSINKILVRVIKSQLRYQGYFDFEDIYCGNPHYHYYVNVYIGPSSGNYTTTNTCNASNQYTGAGNILPTSNIESLGNKWWKSSNLTSPLLPGQFITYFIQDTSGCSYWEMIRVYNSPTQDYVEYRLNGVISGGFYLCKSETILWHMVYANPGAISSSPCNYSIKLSSCSQKLPPNSLS